MSNHTHHTAPTQFVEANGIRFAYRRFGKKEGVPLVFNPHILGNLDSWDPAVTDGLAQSREVILFDNAGVASSSGEVPHTFADMAKNAGVFVDALGLAKVDVLGFSIGSMVAQNIALERPDLVRKLVIVGGGPRNGDGIPLTTESQLIFTNKYGNLDDFWMDGFFTTSTESQAAGLTNDVGCSITTRAKMIRPNISESVAQPQIKLKRRDSERPNSLALACKLSPRAVKPLCVRREWWSRLPSGRGVTRRSASLRKEYRTPSI